jgi:hypothetical protein
MGLERRETVMVHIYQLLIVFGIVAFLTLLTGCGPATSTGQSGHPLATTTPSPGAEPSPGATSTPTGTVSAGPVTLHVDASSYQVYDTISVTLSNQSNQTIYFPDHLTDCSVILLQQLEGQSPTSGSGPSSVSPCRAEMVTRMHTLAPRQSLSVSLVAPSNGWSPGLYRAALSYTIPLKGTTTIYSGTFPVGSYVP